jgi:hypothetical protein
MLVEVRKEEHIGEDYTHTQPARDRGCLTGGGGARRRPHNKGTERDQQGGTESPSALNKADPKIKAAIEGAPG